MMAWVELPVQRSTVNGPSSFQISRAHSGRKTNLRRQTGTKKRVPRAHGLANRWTELADTLKWLVSSWSLEDVIVAEALNESKEFMLAHAGSGISTRASMRTAGSQCWMSSELSDKAWNASNTNEGRFCDEDRVGNC